MIAGSVSLDERHVDPGRRGRPGQREERSRSAPSAEPLRVVLGDVDVLSRCGLASLLEERGMSVVGQAADLGTLLELVGSCRPAVVVLDPMLRARVGAQADAALALRREHPEVGVVVLATQVDVEPAASLLASGTGIGYVLKERVSDVDDFVDTLRRVARGAVVADAALVSAVVDARRHRDPLDVLSPRERDVLTQMAAGRSNYGIAKALWVAPATVEKHVRSILAKLCLPDGPADHRRILAVLMFLDGSAPAGQPGVEDRRS
jgi:DNA-binding NarL/FixJ family response regulator